MKVTMPKDYKEYFTIKDVETARKVIAEVKTWDFTDWTNYAVSDVLPNGVFFEKTLEVNYEICRDLATNDAYFNGSGHIDIWLEATAETTEGFCKIGALLSEVWAVGGDNHLTRYNFRRFKEVK